MKWIIEKEEALTRVDKFLQERIEELSRNRIQQLIDEEAILVNHLPTKANYKIKEGDQIDVTLPENKPLQVKPVAMNLDIVYEDADILVINKEKGVVVHPGAGNEDNTLVSGLLHHCKDLSGINGVLRPGIVHRIDKDTTGLLVVAKNDIAHEALAKQLMDKTMNRKYYCLVFGVIEHDYGTIDAPIGRDKKDRLKMTVTSENSKHAVTHFKVIERFSGYTFVECRLETGRTHQIRVHMQYIKHPIVGDPRYGRKNEFGIQEQLLHAFELTLIHPTTKEEMTFYAPLPVEFENILEELRVRT